MSALFVLFEWIVFFLLLQLIGWYFYFRSEPGTLPHHHKRGKPTLEIERIPDPKFRA